MATITPKLTLNSNASDVVVPGPLSIALSLSTTDAITVGTEVQSGVGGSYTDSHRQSNI